jgi:septum formation protein
MSTRLPLVLGSASPRRTELLASIGMPHEVVPADVEEPLPGTLPPFELVAASARLKARAVAARLPGRLVLGADTMVVRGGSGDAAEVLGKPRGESEAKQMLLRLSGATHRVLTSVVLIGPSGEAEATSATEVSFVALDEAFVERYVATGEPLDKAGSYGAQGFMGTQVSRISGSWTNVVGLPLEVLPALFGQLGETLADWQDW